MLEVKNLYVSFTKDYYTLNDINLSLGQNERIVILGNKESGRTAFLRTLLGLEPIAKGEILINGVMLEKIDFENDISIGYLPSSSVFFERKTVKTNLEYVLKIRKESKEFYEAKVNNALVGYGIEYLKNKKVKELNYLDRVKLSLARLSLRNIDFFLIDDIFTRLSSIDRAGIIKELKALIKSNGASAIIMSDSKEVADAFGYKVKYMRFGSLNDTEDTAQN